MNQTEKLRDILMDKFLIFNNQTPFIQKVILSTVIMSRSSKHFEVIEKNFDTYLPILFKYIEFCTKELFRNPNFDLHYIEENDYEDLANIIAQEFIFKYDVEKAHQVEVCNYLEHLFFLLVFMEEEGWDAKKIPAFLSDVKKIDKIDTSYDALRDYANILLN